MCVCKAFKCEGQLLSTLAFIDLAQTSLYKANHKQILHLEFQDLNLTCMMYHSTFTISATDCRVIS
jgi:hypothetical protein